MGNGKDYIMRDFMICSPHHWRDLGGGARGGNAPPTFF